MNSSMYSCPESCMNSYKNMNTFMGVLSVNLCVFLLNCIYRCLYFTSVINTTVYYCGPVSKILSNCAPLTQARF